MIRPNLATLQQRVLGHLLNRRQFHSGKNMYDTDGLPSRSKAKPLRAAAKVRVFFHWRSHHIFSEDGFSDVQIHLWEQKKRLTAVVPSFRPSMQWIRMVGLLSYLN